MTFITGLRPTNGEIVVYSIMSLCYLGAALLTVIMGHAQFYYRSSIAIHFLFPLCCLISTMKTLSLAMSGTIITNVKSGYVYFLYASEALIVPIFLNVIYEITYLVHKRRSVKFCGLFFDEGKRVKVITTPVRSFVLRNFIRILGI
ncbi:MAG: hypothetical protein ACREBR_03800 [bacterium]